MNTVAIVFSFIQWIFITSIVYYLYDLKKRDCQCALHKPYQVLYIGAWILWVIRTVLIVGELAVGKNLLKLYKPFLILSLLLTLGFYSVSIYYIQHLYRMPCECSQSILQLIYFIYSIIKLAWVVFAVMALMTVYILFRKMK
jgi:heme/copper-type cytochrome/quinol oxidase subunit 3